MEQGAICRRGQSGRFYSYERLAAIGFGLLAVFSPLYIDRRQETEEEVDLESWLPPLLLMVLVVAIALSRSSDRSLCRLDPYWIHRVVGSSCWDSCYSHRSCSGFEV
ncbi:hypothetical protein L1049_018607 [Liquidambar formosana]|uniref:Uncharacterized protein n=1 Tax=Liquidambar formosana TaxID=63359 RepID=A0AAP0RB85_LIQFO